MTALRGVNLGGWLVLEKWMTPSLFAGTDAVDEYTFMQTDGAARKLETHRQTFITEQDFAWIANQGLNAVRIPFGYWLLSDAAPYEAGAKYLDWALNMAQKYGLFVLLDLHALPGSQNGNDHSGRIGPAEWQRQKAYRQESLRHIRTIAERYGSHPSVWGIEIINEPNAAALQLRLRTYYRRAYRLIRRTVPDHVRVVYSDAWTPRLLSLALPFRKQAVMDVHLYHMATVGAKSHPLDWFYARFKRRIQMLRRASRLHPIIIGEWSGVVSHETIGRLPASEQDAILKTYVALQQDEYRSFAGWFYWSYKTEEQSHWNYRAMVERGLITKLDALKQ